jgi:hypothetical protein
MRMGGRTMRKSVPLWLVVVLLVAMSIGTVTALTILALQIEKINIWGGRYQDTDFAVVNFETKIKGPHKIEITVTLKNTDTATHSGDVTVQLLDMNGDIILEQTQNTGDVAGGETWSYTFTFRQDNLVEQYDRPFLVVRQTG